MSNEKLYCPACGVDSDIETSNVGGEEILSCRTCGLELDTGGAAVNYEPIGDILFAEDSDLLRIALKDRIDKHLFSIEKVAALANEIDHMVSFVNYERPEFYEVFMRAMLDTYNIAHERFVEVSERLYSDFYSYVGNDFASHYSHYRFIVLTKR